MYQLFSQYTDTPHTYLYNYFHFVTFKKTFSSRTQSRFSVTSSFVRHYICSNLLLKILFTYQFHIYVKFIEFNLKVFATFVIFGLTTIINVTYGCRVSCYEFSHV